LLDSLLQEKEIFLKQKLEDLSELQNVWKQRNARGNSNE